MARWKTLSGEKKKAKICHVCSLQMTQKIYNKILLSAETIMPSCKILCDGRLLYPTTYSPNYVTWWRQYDAKGGSFRELWGSWLNLIGMDFAKLRELLERKPVKIIWTKKTHTTTAASVVQINAYYFDKITPNPNVYLLSVFEVDPHRLTFKNKSHQMNKTGKQNTSKDS